MRCVGTAVVDGAGKVRGASSVAGPAFRMTMERVRGLGPELAEVARRVGAQLSVIAPAPAATVARAVAGPWAFRGEFARWSARHRCLFWADSLAPSVRSFDGNLDREIAVFGSPLTGMTVWGDALLVASRSGYWRVDDPETSAPSVSALQPWTSGPPSARCTAPDGVVWACERAEEGRWRVAPWPVAGANPPEGSWTLGGPLDALAWDGAAQCLYGLSGDSGEIVVMRRGQAAVRRLATLPKASDALAVWPLTALAASGPPCRTAGAWYAFRPTATRTG